MLKWWKIMVFPSINPSCRGKIKKKGPHEMKNGKKAD
jgi:hypothetical protein